MREMARVTKKSSWRIKVHKRKADKGVSAASAAQLRRASFRPCAVNSRN
jgi:hypothetical protein